MTDRPPIPVLGFEPTTPAADGPQAPEMATASEPAAPTPVSPPAQALPRPTGPSPAMAAALRCSDLIDLDGPAPAFRTASEHYAELRSAMAREGARLGRTGGRLVAGSVLVSGMLVTTAGADVDGAPSRGSGVGAASTPTECVVEGPDVEAALAPMADIIRTVFSGPTADGVEVAVTVAAGDDECVLVCPEPPYLWPHCPPIDDGSPGDSDDDSDDQVVVEDDTGEEVEATDGDDPIGDLLDAIVGDEPPVVDQPQPAPAPPTAEVPAPTPAPPAVVDEAPAAPAPPTVDEAPTVPEADSRPETPAPPADLAPPAAPEADVAPSAPSAPPAPPEVDDEAPTAPSAPTIDEAPTVPEADTRPETPAQPAAPTPPPADPLETPMPTGPAGYDLRDYADIIADEVREAGDEPDVDETAIISNVNATGGATVPRPGRDRPRGRLAEVEFGVKGQHRETIVTEVDPTGQVIVDVETRNGVLGVGKVEIGRFGGGATIAPQHVEQTVATYSPETVAEIRDGAEPPGWDSLPSLNPGDSIETNGYESEAGINGSQNEYDVLAGIGAGQWVDRTLDAETTVVEKLDEDTVEVMTGTRENTNTRTDVRIGLDFSETLGLRGEYGALREIVDETWEGTAARYDVGDETAVDADELTRAEDHLRTGDPQLEPFDVYDEVNGSSQLVRDHRELRGSRSGQGPEVSVRERDIHRESFYSEEHRTAHITATGDVDDGVPIESSTTTVDRRFGADWDALELANHPNITVEVTDWVDPGGGFGQTVTVRNGDVVTVFDGFALQEAARAEAEADDSWDWGRNEVVDDLAETASVRTALSDMRPTDQQPRTSTADLVDAFDRLSHAATSVDHGFGPTDPQGFGDPELGEFGGIPEMIDDDSDDTAPDTPATSNDGLDAFGGPGPDIDTAPDTPATSNDGLDAFGGPGPDIDTSPPAAPETPDTPDNSWDAPDERDDRSFNDTTPDTPATSNDGLDAFGGPGPDIDTSPPAAPETPDTPDNSWDAPDERDDRSFNDTTPDTPATSNDGLDAFGGPGPDIDTSPPAAPETPDTPDNSWDAPDERDDRSFNDTTPDTPATSNDGLDAFGGPGPDISDRTGDDRDDDRDSSPSSPSSDRSSDRDDSRDDDRDDDRDSPSSDRSSDRDSSPSSSSSSDRDSSPSSSSSSDRDSSPSSSSSSSPSSSSSSASSSSQDSSWDAPDERDDRSFNDSSPATSDDGLDAFGGPGPDVDTSSSSSSSNDSGGWDWGGWDGYI